MLAWILFNICCCLKAATKTEVIEVIVTTVLCVKNVHLREVLNSVRNGSLMFNLELTTSLQLTAS